jgi:hypothetical protein
LAFSSALCHELPPANSTIGRFDGRFWALDFPLTSIATVVSNDPTELEVNCEFRSNRDLVGLLWWTKDKYGHPLCQYVEDQDYTGTICAFVANPPRPYDFNITVQTKGGPQVVRLFPYGIVGEGEVVPIVRTVPDGTAINDIPVGYESGPGPGVNYTVAQLFPGGTPAVPEGYYIFVMDFSTMRRGFNYDQGAVDVTHISQLFLSLVPPQFGLGEGAKVRHVGAAVGTDQPGYIRPLATETITHFTIDNVNPTLRFTKGDVILMELGVPEDPEVKGKSVKYKLVPTELKYQVMEWDGDGTTTRRIKVNNDEGQLKDVMFQGGAALALTLQSDSPIGSVPMQFRMQSISTTGARAVLPRRLYPQPAHGLAMTSGYDDTYNITPWRQVDNTWQQGYRGFFTCYMGMSHYFKAESTGAPSKFINQVIKDAAQPLNLPTQKWCESLFALMVPLGYKFVWSTSYEILSSYMPDDWCQRDYLQRRGLSGWVPPSAFVIPAYLDGPVDYLARVIKHGLSLMAAAGMELHFQIGEPWWWDGSYSNGAPAIYDPYTQAKYTAETGNAVPLPLIHDYRDDYTGREPYLEWLGVKLGQSTNYIRDNVKTAYPGSLATLLFFSPQIFAGVQTGAGGLPIPGSDPTNNGLLSIINFPVDEWKWPNYDFMQIEDYDWIIRSELEKLPLTRQAAVDILEYPIDVVHYFVGFVLLPRETWIWPNMNIAVRDAILAGLSHVAVWAYPQVIRDGIVYDDRLIVTEPAVYPELVKRRQLPDDVAAMMVRPVLFASIGTDIYMNSSDRAIVFDGQTWHATGSFGKVEQLTEGITLADSGWRMSLTGLPFNQVIPATSAMRGKKVRLYVALLDGNYQLVADPRLIGAGDIFDAQGKMDDKVGTVQISVRSRLANWHETKILRYTHEAQMMKYPGDRGLQFVSDLVNRKLKWGDQNA